MFHAFGNNPITYTDPDGRFDWKAELKYAGRETLQTFNGDFGADFMLEAENDFAEGRYFNSAIHFLDACAEAFFDVWGIDRRPTPETELVKKTTSGIKTSANLQAVNQLSSVLDIDKRIAEVFFEIGKGYPESAVNLANNCIEYCKNFGNPAAISTIFSNMKKSGGGKVLGDVMNYVSDLIISIPYRTNKDKELFMILTQIQNYAGTFRD